MNVTKYLISCILQNISLLKYFIVPKGYIKSILWTWFMINVYEQECPSCQFCFQYQKHMSLWPFNMMFFKTNQPNGSLKQPNFLLIFEGPTLHLCYLNCFCISALVSEDTDLSDQTLNHHEVDDHWTWMFVVKGMTVDKKLLKVDKSGWKLMRVIKLINVDCGGKVLKVSESGWKLSNCKNAKMQVWKCLEECGRKTKVRISEINKLKR